MAKLTRIVSRIFGSGAGFDQIAQFGSKFAGSPTFTTDPAQAQALSNWLTGWFGAAIGGNAPAIEDMNSVLFVLSYLISYQMQQGIPEWDSGTTYFIGSLAMSSAGVVYISKTDDNLNNLLSSTANWKVVGGDIMSTLGDIIYAGSNGDASRLAGNITTTKKYLSQTGSGSLSAAPTWQALGAPTLTRLTSGSGTYTPPAGVSYLKIRMVGGGGGGQGGGTSQANGGNGGDTTFGSSLLVASGGKGGGVASGGGAASISAPAYGSAFTGSDGGGTGSTASSSGTPVFGGSAGASSPFGGAGAGADNSTAGNAAKANTGSGGGGGGTDTTFSSTGKGGAAGGYLEAIVPSPTGTYAYAVGAAGSAGTGQYAGGAGGAGILIIEEYQ